LPVSRGTLNEAASMANNSRAAPALVNGLGPSRTALGRQTPAGSSQKTTGPTTLSNIDPKS
jgi:hypothetical protein